MKVLLITNEYPNIKLAGTSFATYNLAKYLKEKGNLVKVLLVREAADRKISSLIDKDLISLRLKPPKTLGWIFRLFFVFKEALCFKPDIIQGQSISCGVFAALVGRSLRIPSITYVQGYDFYEAAPWQLTSEIRFGCLLPKGLVCVTMDLARRIKGRYKRADIQVIPHGFQSCPDPVFINVLNIEKRSPGVSKIILSVGRLEIIKGHDILLRAWQKVCSEFSGARLWIVGEGSEKNNLIRLSQNLKIGETVRFWGSLPAPKVASLMACSDLFVLPSRSEPFGIVLLEAMSQGMPIVSTCVGGIPEVLPPDGDVVSVAVDDPIALAKGIIKGLSKFHPPSHSNRTWAEPFHWENIVSRFENLYVSMQNIA